MGRARKPLAAQKGDLTVAKQVEMEVAEAAVSGDQSALTKPPRWLIDSEAKKEWKRLTGELCKLKVIGNLDLNNIGAYCNAYSLYRQAMAAVAAHPLDKELCDVMKKYADEMRRFAALCGLTLDARLKLGSVLAEKQQAEIDERFGDI